MLFILETICLRRATTSHSGFKDGEYGIFNVHLFYGVFGSIGNLLFGKYRDFSMFNYMYWVSQRLCCICYEEIPKVSIKIRIGILFTWFYSFNARV